MFDNPPQFQTKEEYAYQSLRKAIIRCEFAPGEKLVIDRLSGHLGISQIPIRAALQRLQAEGLVFLTPHSGASVAPLEPEKIFEIFMLLESLESSAFLAASERMNVDDLKDLEELIKQLDNAVEDSDPETWMALNILFHRRIAEISAMPLLVEFTNRTLDEWERLSHCYFRKIGPKRMKEAQEEHHQILALLTAKESDRLVKIASDHNRHAWQNYKLMLEKGLD